jgi:eukaryotic-like serine/threonine-protein kinase
MDEVIDSTAERARARVGSTLKDKWTLEKILGVGGMATVYAGTHRNGMRVAVKILHPELSVNNEIKTRFLREGYLANKVEHPGAVMVLDDEVDDDGSVFLVMELLDGETLSSRWERKARNLTMEEILLIADQLLDVLAAAHDKEIVHRDIKPDNIFLTRSGSVKLLDFGIARLRELSTESNATRSGATMGTPAYMAPEQARARWDEVDARTDVWAVGATMFKLLTGHVVHQAETVNEQLLLAMTKPAVPIATLVPTAPCPVVEIIDKALAFEKRDRWKDARGMQEAVRAAYQSLVGTLPAGMRLSFDDAPGSSAVQAATVPSSNRMPTALSVSRESSSFPVRRTGRRKTRWGFLMVLLGCGVIAYAFVKSGKKPQDLAALLPAELTPEAGVQAVAVPSRGESVSEVPSVAPAAVPAAPATLSAAASAVSAPPAASAVPVDDAAAAPQPEPVASADEDDEEPPPATPGRSVTPAKPASNGKQGTVRKPTPVKKHTTRRHRRH